MPSPLKRFSALLKSNKDEKNQGNTTDTSTGVSPNKPGLNENVNRNNERRVVCITGASVGLGYELVKTFASETGTLVIALDSGDPSSELKAALTNDVIHVNLGGAHEKDLVRVKSEIEKHSRGGIDLLVNTAVPTKHSTKSLGQIGHGELHSEITSMITSPLTLTNALLPLMRTHGNTSHSTGTAANKVEPQVASATTGHHTTGHHTTGHHATGVEPTGAGTTGNSNVANTNTNTEGLVTDSSGNPVSKDALIIQKFLADDKQDPKLLPHVPGPIFKKERAAHEEAVAAGEEPKFREHTPPKVTDGSEHAVLSDSAPATESTTHPGVATTDATQTSRTENREGLATGPTTGNNAVHGNTTATTAPAHTTGVAGNSTTISPNHQTLSIIAFVTTSSNDAHGQSSSHKATQAIAHAAIHLAIRKYAHDSQHGVLVIGVDAGDFDHTAANSNANQTAIIIAEKINGANSHDSGKVLHTQTHSSGHNHGTTAHANPQANTAHAATAHHGMPAQQTGPASVAV